MSTIPPNWLGSIIQTHGAQDRAAEAKNKERAGDAERAGKEGVAERLQDIIENSDRDSEVYADAEGAGSQGRPFSDEEEAEQEQDSAADEDEEGRGSLDVEA
jgi:hypothetical protein